MTKSNKRKLSLAIQIALFSSSITLAAQAQTQDDSANDEESVEKITVTGSRIKRDSFSLSTPITVINRDNITDLGLNGLGDLLTEEIPALAPATTTTNSQSSISNSGLSTVDLRNLGSNRTLVLIDGRRTVSNSTSSNTVSLGTIPAGLVERVEIINGGASSIYGSDAIAGVVNIITQSEKEGFTFTANGGRTTEGAGEEFTLSGDYGGEFASGKGYVFASAIYNREFGIRSTDRARRGALLPARFEYDEDTGTNIVETAEGDRLLSETPPELFSSLSSEPIGGRFLGGDFFFDENGLQTDFVADRDGFNDKPFDIIDSPRDRVAAAIKVDYELSDTVSFNAQFQASETESSVERIPEGLRSSDNINIIDPVTGVISQIQPDEISINNPFVPEAIALSADGDIDFRRRFVELGDVSRENTRRTFRGWAGLKGTLFNDNWEWDVSAGFGRYTQDQVRTNEINVFNFNEAINAEVGPNGEIRCANEAARANGCVPLNIFGVGSVTSEAGDFIRANPVIEADLEQYNVLGFITGDLVQLPAGPLGAVFGFEYREDRLSRQVDELSQFGGVTNNLTPAFTGSIDATEIFSEFNVPLLKDAPAAKELTTEFSFRLSDYSQTNVGLVTSYKAGVIWEPIEGYRFRANYARSQRAPDINEIFSPPAGDFDRVNDICEGATLTSTDAGHDNCRLEPGILAEIMAEGEFESPRSIHSPNGGNPDLKEETGDTIFVGIVATPTFVDNLSVAVDFYDIKISDAISQIGNEEILRECYASNTPFGDDNTFCQRVERSLEDGTITTLLQTSENLSERRARGVDVAFDYRHEIGAYGILDYRLNYNHVIENSQTFDTDDGSSVTTQFAGSLSDEVFEDRARAAVTWRYNDLRVRWTTRFRGDTVDSFQRLEDFREVQAQIPDAEVPNGLFFSSFTTHNVAVTYDFTLQNDSEIRVTAGANNIFNNLGPFVAEDGDIESGENGNTNPLIGGLIGRFVFLRAEYRF